MEETLKDDSSSATAKTVKSASTLLRYPLRSASKPKEEKLTLADSSNSSVPRARSQVISSVSRSASVLDLSGKEKSAAKPPRRQSILSKSSANSPSQKLAGNITPISQIRPKKTPVKVDTTPPVSDNLNRKKFSVLSSASYWVSQIRVSEAASKHSISLGFFRLALDAGCEPLQILRDELKAYTRRHNLAQFEESTKDLLKKYNISEDFEQLQVSETVSNVPEDDETRSSCDDNHSKIAHQAKKDTPITTNKEKTHKNAAKSKHGLKYSGDSSKKSTQQPKQMKLESRKGCDDNNMEKHGKNDVGKGVNESPMEHELQENKENLAELQTEELNHQSEV